MLNRIVEYIRVALILLVVCLQALLIGGMMLFDKLTTKPIEVKEVQDESITSRDL